MTKNDGWFWETPKYDRGTSHDRLVSHRNSTSILTGMLEMGIFLGMVARGPNHRSWNSMAPECHSPLTGVTLRGFRSSSFDPRLRGCLWEAITSSGTGSSIRAFARWSQGLWVIKILHDSSPARADKNGFGWSETGVEPRVFPGSHQAEWVPMGSVCWGLARPCIKFRDARLYSLSCVLWKGYLLLVCE